jgi:type II secretory pathway component HofQ
MSKQRRIEELAILIKSYNKRKERAIKNSNYSLAAQSLEKERDYIAELENIKMKL